MVFIGRKTFRVIFYCLQTSDTDEDDEVSAKKKKEDEPAPSSASKDPPKKRRLKCKFGAKCFRKNRNHRKEYCHPGDSDEDEAVGE